jgi:hypothetical protein
MSCVAPGSMKLSGSASCRNSWRGRWEQPKPSRDGANEDTKEEYGVGEGRGGENMRWRLAWKS